MQKRKIVVLTIDYCPFAWFAHTYVPTYLRSTLNFFMRRRILGAQCSEEEKVSEFACARKKERKTYI